MFKMNNILKNILVLIILSIVIVTKNRIILWLLLLFMTIYNLHKYKKLLLVVDIILVLLLGLSKESEIYLLLFKILFLMNFIITIYTSLRGPEKRNLLKRNKSSKINYYEDNFERIVANIKEQKSSIYDEDVSIDNKIERDLERQYLQAKIRYYNYYTKRKSYNLNIINILLVIVVIILLFFLRQV